MVVFLLVIIMLLVGLLIGWLAGLIWHRRPIGLSGDLLVAMLTAVVIGLIDWYVIPAMGFSTGLRNLGVALEPAIGALLVLWLIRRARPA